MKAAGILLAIAVAIVLQTTLGRFITRGPVVIDLVLVVVVYVALAAGPVAGLLSGAMGGLIQDALSSGVIGIGGLSKTIVGFVAGIIGTQFIVAHSVPRFVVFFCATVVHAVIFIGLYAVLGLRPFGIPFAATGGQALGNAIIGVIAFNAAELLPGAVERRRTARTSRMRR